MEQHEKFHMNVLEIASIIETVNFYSLLVAIISFALIIMAPKVLPKVPGALIGILLSSVVTVKRNIFIIRQMTQYQRHASISRYINVLDARTMHLKNANCYQMASHYQSMKCRHRIN